MAIRCNACRLHGRVSGCPTAADPHRAPSPRKPSGSSGSGHHENPATSNSSSGTRRAVSRGTRCATYRFPRERMSTSAPTIMSADALGRSTGRLDPNITRPAPKCATTYSMSGPRSASATSISHRGRVRNPAPVRRAESFTTTLGCADRVIIRSRHNHRDVGACGGRGTGAHARPDQPPPARQKWSAMIVASGYSRARVTTSVQLMRVHEGLDRQPLHLRPPRNAAGSPPTTARRRRRPVQHPRIRMVRGAKANRSYPIGDLEVLVERGTEVVGYGDRPDHDRAQCRSQSLTEGQRRR